MKRFNKTVLLANLALCLLCCKDPKSGPHLDLVMEMDTVDYRNKVLAIKDYDPVREKDMLRQGLEYAAKSIERRLEKFGIEKNAFEVKVKDQLIWISIWGTGGNENGSGRLKKLLESNANLELWETCFNTELSRFARMQDTVVPISETLKRGLMGGQSPVVAKVRSIDTSAFLRELKNYFSFPEEIKLAWSAPDKNFDRHDLFLLKATKDGEGKYGAAISGNFIENARMDLEQGAPSILFTMNAEAAAKWKLLTKSNLGRAIAIVLDGYVYSAPIVQSEISNGNCQISGGFSKKEAEDLVAVFNAGSYPAAMKIVQLNYSEK